MTKVLRVAAGRGQDIAERGFEQVADLVGGLPQSADVRQWWANSSHSQTLAWRTAGFHVDQVHLDRRRVRFAHGERGGSYDGRGGVALPRQTSLRINALLREHLSAGGAVALTAATAATAWLNGVEQPLDLTRKAGRLLAESAALVLARATDDAEIMNLG